MRQAWRDGTTHLLFEPGEFLEKLAGLTPRPEVHLPLYHGVLAPHTRWRRQIVGFRRAAASEEAAARRAERGASRCPRYRAWATLMRRAFGIDVLACPRCGGRLRLIATMENPAVVGKILAHLSLLHPADSPGPAPPSADPRAAAPSHQ